MKKKLKTYPVVVQEWTESERGWGLRSDGASLHLTRADLDAYIADCNARERERNPSGVVPDEYDFPHGAPSVMDVDSKTYQKIKKSKNGIRLWRSEYVALKGAQ